MPDWAITAMTSIGEKAIGFENQTEAAIDPVTEIEAGRNPEDPIEAPETDEDELVDDDDSIEEFDDEAIRVLEEAADLQQANFEEEQRDEGVHTRVRVVPVRFQSDLEADRYAEYVAMWWREPEPPGHW